MIEFISVISLPFLFLQEQNTMQMVTVEIQNNDALQVLQDLQKKKLINILATPNFNSVVFPGEPLTAEEFNHLVAEAESASNISLHEAKTTWAKQRQALRIILTRL